MIAAASANVERVQEKRGEKMR